MMNGYRKRGKQSEYNKLLDAFNAGSKTKKESVEYLLVKGFSPSQAENAVHVYWKGGETEASSPLLEERRNQLLDDINATRKRPKECVDYLMNQGCTYRQANSAVYKYRQEKGLIGS